jgi:hypothetical protein
MQKPAVNSVAHPHTDALPPNSHASEDHAEYIAETPAISGDGDMTTTIATIGVVALGVALIEVAWIPGMLIGLAAAFAPKFVPKLGEGVRPLLKQTVRGAYKVAQKTREAVAEAGEQMQDLMAEARAEEQQAAAAVKVAENGSPVKS